MYLWAIKKKVKVLLSRELSFFTSIITLSILLLCIFFYFYSYNVHLTQRNDQLSNVTKIVLQELNDIFEENEHVLNFFGKKLSNKFGTNNLESIANLLTSSIELSIKSMTKSYISWANPDGKVLVSGKEGILEGKFPEINKRKYFVTARQHPWTLQFSDISKSLFSKSIILPTALGIEDKNKNFLGYLVLGLRVDHINQYIEKMIGLSNISFIVLDENSKPILFSSNNISNNEENITLNTDELRMQNLSSKTFLLTRSIKSNNLEYTSGIKMSNYPFTILVGYNIKIDKQNFLYKIIFRLAGFLLISFFCLMIIYFFRKKLEMDNKVAADSDHAREKYIKSMHYELSNYLKEILVYSKVINKYFKSEKNSFTEDQLIKCSDKIQEAVTHIRSKTCNALELVNFDLILTIKQAIQINMKFALFKNVKIVSHFETNIKFNIYADEFRIKQILVSLLYQSIQNSPKHSVVNIRVNQFKELNSIRCKIEIEDNGFGLNEQELISMQEKFGLDEEAEVFEFMHMKMEYIEKLVHMHGGRLDIYNEYHQGRRVSLILPKLGNREIKDDNVIYINCD